MYVGDGCPARPGAGADPGGRKIRARPRFLRQRPLCDAGARAHNAARGGRGRGSWRCRRRGRLSRQGQQAAKRAHGPNAKQLDVQLTADLRSTLELAHQNCFMLVEDEYFQPADVVTEAQVVAAVADVIERSTDKLMRSKCGEI